MPVAVLGAGAASVISRHEVEPVIGVRGAQIVGLMKDLACTLGMASIRVAGTIPGKTCMGQELPDSRRQMEWRYRLMSALGVRNLAGFNARNRDAKAAGRKAPNLFSLMPDAPKPLDKANIPTRLAFQVSSKIDSRTVLDQMGAEARSAMATCCSCRRGRAIRNGCTALSCPTRKCIGWWKI